MKSRNKPKKNRRFAFALILIPLVMLFTAPTAFCEDTISLAEVVSSMDSLKEKKDSMISDGLYVSRINDYITDAEELINGSNIAAASESIKKGEEFAALAYESKALISGLEQKIDVAPKYGIDISVAGKYLSEAKGEFLIENYQGAKDLVQKARGSLSGGIADAYSGILADIQDLILQEASYGIKSGISVELKKEFSRIKDEVLIEEITGLNQEVEGYKDGIFRLKSLENTITEFENFGRTTTRFADIFAAAIIAIEEGEMDDLEAALNDYDDQINAYNEAERYVGIIGDKINELESNGVDTAVFSSEFEEIKRELEVQNYLKASQLGAETLAEIEKSESEKIISQSFVGGFSPKGFIKENPLAILISLIIIGVVIFFSYQSLSIFILKTRHRVLTKRLKVLESMLGDAQRNYFKDKMISRDSYNHLIDECQERIVKARESIFLLEKRMPELKTKSFKKQV